MNTPITAIIVDDEPACIHSLSKDLAAYPDIRVKETTVSTEKARKIIIKQQPDIIFLDVEMPKTNGIELLNEIRPFMHAGTCVVFYSAFDKYLIDALRASAFDYLLKPYLPEELESIISRIKSQFEMGKVNFEQSMRRLLADDRKFALQTVKGLRLLRSSEILYFQFLDDSRCWQMTLTDLSVHKLRVSTTAKDLLNISISFIQISQDCILNIDYISSIENKTLRCALYPPFNHLDICASRRFYSKVKEALEII